MRISGSKEVFILTGAKSVVLLLQMRMDWVIEAPVARLTSLYGFHLEVCTVSVTHLVDAGHLRVERALLNYGKGLGARPRRETRGARIRGGVLVIVRYGVSSRVVSGVVLPQST